MVPSRPGLMVWPRGPMQSESIRRCRSQEQGRRSFAIRHRWCSGSESPGGLEQATDPASVARGGELAVGHDPAADRSEDRARLQEHLLVLGLGVRGGDDRAARADLQPSS